MGDARAVGIGNDAIGGDGGGTTGVVRAGKSGAVVIDDQAALEDRHVDRVLDDL